MSTRLCKYHGRSCEFPGACLNRAPRKYDHDGNLETIDPERLQVGHVLRMNGRGQSAFSDSVVMSIKVVYNRPVKGREYNMCDTLLEALTKAGWNGRSTEKGYVYVKVARPYLYEHIGSPLMGCETYEIGAPHIVDTHKVVVMSTGEYDKRTATFSTQYQEVRQAEEAHMRDNPHRLYHTHNGESGFPHTCPACRADRDKQVQGE